MKAPQPALRAATMFLLIGVSGAVGAQTVDARCDIYPKGSDAAAKVVACTFSQRQGRVAIDRADGVRHELSPRGGPGNYIDENGQKAIRSKGLGPKGQVYRLAKESVFVYWDRAGLPGSAHAVAVTGAPTVLPKASPPPVPFDQTLTLQGISFRISSANSGSINELTIEPRGLEIDNQTIVRPIDGQIMRADIADLNADGSPEVYVYVRSAGSGSYGTLAAYSVNRRKSISDINLPPVTDNAEAAKGYRGHDEFAVVESSLVRRFPIYQMGDTNAAPSGGVRQLQYKLTPGEASWQLRFDRMVEY